MITTEAKVCEFCGDEPGPDHERHCPLLPQQCKFCGQLLARAVKAPHERTCTERPQLGAAVASSSSAPASSRPGSKMTLRKDASGSGTIGAGEAAVPRASKTVLSRAKNKMFIGIGNEDIMMASAPCSSYDVCRTGVISSPTPGEDGAREDARSSRSGSKKSSTAASADPGLDDKAAAAAGEGKKSAPASRNTSKNATPREAKATQPRPPSAQKPRRPPPPSLAMYRKPRTQKTPRRQQSTNLTPLSPRQKAWLLSSTKPVLKLLELDLEDEAQRLREEIQCERQKYIASRLGLEDAPELHEVTKLVIREAGSRCQGSGLWSRLEASVVNDDFDMPSVEDLREQVQRGRATFLGQSWPPAAAPAEEAAAR